MSTFGCHSCGVNLKDYADKPYESWPCASCALAKNYYHTFSTGYFDTAKAEGIEDEKARLDDETDPDYVMLGSFPLQEHEVQTLRTIQKAVANQIYAMFSGILVKLLRLGKTNPLAFEVFIKKMQFPYMSYSEIGDTLTPKCTKQNVLYHLKAVVKDFPDLESIILTDTRYSNGHYALKTIADKRKQQIAEERVQKIIFNNKYGEYRFTIEELNKVLHLPFNIPTEVFDFNAYLGDDFHLEEENGKAEDKG